MDYKIKKYKVEIKGNSPVIWNVMKREIELEKQKLKKNELSEWEEKNWHKKAEFDSKGTVIIPDRWFKAMIETSAKQTRIVPHFATRKNETYTNYVNSFMVYSKGKGFKIKDLEYYGQYVGAQGKNSTTKVWRVRPMVEKWSWEFEIIDPAGRMKQEELKALIGYGGLFIGIGDNRKSNYGRFEITKISGE